MRQDDRQALLRAIPSVDEVLSHAPVAALQQRHPAFPWTALVRAVLDELRAMDTPATVLARGDREGIRDWAAQRVVSEADDLVHGGLRAVLNGTGVILHTNLGRAPWSRAAVEAAGAAMSGYVSLEVDMETGERSKRGALVERMLCLATGAEAAMVVNNNAAAVYLCVNSFSPPARVIVSRGELVEIGGSFRLPEILRHAAAEVIEVGTTNRTYAKDYAAVAREGDVILKVHKSNYAIEGFAHEATVAELCEVAGVTGAHMVYDMGSGTFYDLAAAGVGDDPAVEDVIARGVTAVTMSADKLLGSAQAGIIAGRSGFVSHVRQNPLRRAVRVDKVTLAALQEALRVYLFAPDARAGVPVLGQMLASAAAQRARAEAVAKGLAAPGPETIGVCDDDAAVGGGSLAAEKVPSAAVSITCPDERAATALVRRMRLGDPPLFARIRGREVRINMTTILPGQEDALRAALESALSG